MLGVLVSSRRDAFCTVCCVLHLQAGLNSKRKKQPLCWHWLTEEKYSLLPPPPPLPPTPLPPPPLSPLFLSLTANAFQCFSNKNKNFWIYSQTNWKNRHGFQVSLKKNIVSFSATACTSDYFTVWSSEQFQCLGLFQRQKKGAFVGVCTAPSVPNVRWQILTWQLWEMATLPSLCKAPWDWRKNTENVSSFRGFQGTEKICLMRLWDVSLSRKKPLQILLPHAFKWRRTGGKTERKMRAQHLNCILYTLEPWGHVS